VVIRSHAVAILAVGFAVLPAWGQAPWAGGGFTPFPSGPVTAPAATSPAAATTKPAATTTAVAAFPDVAPARPAAPQHDDVTDLLATDPYAAELAFREAQRNLFGDGLEDDDPYAEALRLVNPYSVPAATARNTVPANPYRGATARNVDLAKPYAAARASGADLANPYTTAPLGPDLSNPYRR
jgi:hypothetical protein